MKQEIVSDHHSGGLVLGRLIQEHRKAAGISQAQLGRELNLSESYISRLEHGEFRTPQPGVLMALAKRFDININDLYAITGCLLSTELPSFSAYVHAKHPDWPETVIAELADYYEFLKQKHSLH